MNILVFTSGVSSLKLKKVNISVKRKEAEYKIIEELKIVEYKNIINICTILHILFFVLYNLHIFI